MQEFRKVFRPHGCDLHAMNASHFSQCLAGQRMIIIGDSTMRQVFQSLGCLLHEEVVDGYLVVCPLITHTGAAMYRHHVTPELLSLGCNINCTL